MKAPTSDACYMGDVAHAANVSVTWLEKTMSRKLFEPSNRTIAGRSRIFNEFDAIRIAVMKVLAQRYQLPMAIAARVARRMKERLPEFETNLKTTRKPVFLVLSPVTNDWAIDFVIGIAEMNEVMRERQIPGSWSFGAICMNVTILAIETSDRLQRHIESETQIDEQLRARGDLSVYDDVEEES